MVKYLEGRDTPVSDLEANANIESDYEEGSPSVLKEKENQSEENRAVFITGSYSAYAIFYPVPFSREMTSCSVGNPSFSTVAPTRSCSHP